MVPSKFKGDLILLPVNDASRPGFCSLLTLVNVCFFIFIACWVIFHAFAVFKINFLNNFFFKNTIRVSNSLDPDHDRRFVGPDLGPNCLQRLSADDKFESPLARKELIC